MTIGIRHARCLHALLLAGALLGCESVLGAPDYRVVEQGASELMVLYAADAPSVPDCTRCLAGGECGEAFARCAEMPGCPAFAACTLERPSPASEAECVVRLVPTDAVRSTVTAMSRCFATCYSDCGGGEDFSCAGNYSFPGALSNGTVRLTQTLRFLFSPLEPVGGLAISICPPTMTCDAPIATAVTDETGTYHADVPITTDPVSEAGFRGYRIVHGEPGRLFPHRLHQSRPIMVDQFEETSISTEALTLEALKRVGLEQPNVILLQILDCRLVGARGIYFELDSGRVVYSEGIGLWSETGPTRPSQEGSGAALELETGAHHEIRAVTETGELVAVDTIYLPRDELVFSLLFPREAE